METKFYNNITVLDSVDKGDFKAEILQYNSLTGSKDPAIARNLHYTQMAGMHLKQVKVTLNDSGVIVEPGALYFHKGNIACESNIGGVGGLAKKMLHNKLTNESTFKPRYTGTGEVFLEPGFSHFLIVKLDNGSVIVDKGIFYCCEDTLEVGVASQKNISAGLFGGDWFQTRISGTGICVLESPVPMNEILKCNLNNERLQVDGNFALLRSDSVNFSVERSSKGIAGSMTSGEGRLQTFEGTGIVWLAPTQPVYNSISAGSISSLAAAPYNRNNPA
ncbi:AIM24 family protein [Methanolobus sp. ZRKC4]|uniref:AIM24 family protein n=1 Tax=Methanolobus sp. ZRKC4 TaxID=3125787 RepID=UPI003255D768